MFLNFFLLRVESGIFFDLFPERKLSNYIFFSFLQNLLRLQSRRSYKPENDLSEYKMFEFEMYLLKIDSGEVRLGLLRLSCVGLW